MYYLQAWRKYLPAIVILIKRSATAPQTLAMDKDDFVKSSGGKKIALGFTGVTISKGRMYINAAYSQTAKDLVLILSESDQIKSILTEDGLQFSMSNDCLLEISSVNEPVFSPSHTH